MKYSLEHVASIWALENKREIIECMNDLWPELQTILDAELKAGNQVLEASRDWPDAGSVFITLIKRFQKNSAVNESVQYNEENDPHYWHADYSCGKPVHTLAC